MKLVISLSFMGQCREAMQFYADVLGGRLLPFATYGTPRRSPVWNLIRNTKTGS